MAKNKTHTWRKISINEVRVGSRIKVKYPSAGTLKTSVTHVWTNGEVVYMARLSVGRFVIAATDDIEIYVKEPIDAPEIGSDIRAKHAESGAVLTGIVTENFNGLGVSIKGVATVWKLDGWTWEKIT